ncbi:JmjC domain protein [Aspergillus heteromorphus CBS 117.55]|uniref:JmjC domain protein n=1 Tax=Aspergillus heteromorphus CBS 117.55 TaxID=1448321 RepID=A0A317WPZ0_9EURO|nr:JmjC domain protein [Aspergillus heteromorphus CBS 117.55]PWY86300.1 JmjC domain protein [Aspergillus heteromorphus CBS 117.55]
MRHNKLQGWPCWPSAAFKYSLPSQRQQQQRGLTSQSGSVTASPPYRPPETLRDVDINHFRDGYFTRERPVILPRRYFHDIPAFERWFRPSLIDPDVSQLNTAYLSQHDAGSFVPLELTQPLPDNNTSEQQADGLTFRQFHAPLSLFLEWILTAETLETQPTRLYLAQCQLLDLPQKLRDDFPTPQLVAQAGKGDIYDTNVWIGYPPTYTPLHRDPNPNLFVQLAGQKIVRLLPPDDGQKVFGSVRRELGRSAGREAAAIRGEEMMQGQERVLLEQAVWDDAKAALGPCGYEARLEAGDGLFIPRGWWHTIKGVGKGVTASVSFLIINICTHTYFQQVNWWFR